MGIRQLLAAWQGDQAAEAHRMAAMAQAMRLSRMEDQAAFSEAIDKLTAV